MAGYMYLGSQRVCPAIVSGGSPEPEPTEYLTVKFPDSMVEPPDQEYYLQPMVLTSDGNNFEPVIIDFNNVKTFSGNLVPSKTYFEGVPIIPKVEKIEKLAGHGFRYLANKCLSVDGYKDINFKNLTEVVGSGLGFAFNNTNQKTFNNIYFPKLTKMGSSSFVSFGNTGVDIYFSAVVTSSFQSSDVLGYIGMGNNKTLHFPSNLQTTIQNQDGYPNFNGTNTTILYDLPATE